MLKLRLTQPDGGTLEGFRYFWLKRVTGFNPSVHCASCLKGTYAPALGPDMPAGKDIAVDAKPGDVFYLCGVAKPYLWSNNAHLAFRVRAGARVTMALHTGAVIEVVGAERLPFTDQQARTFYPDKGKAFLTCRNYQFGAALHHGAIR